ncbi:DUF222 domain-containing protein [Cryobacterium sp. SO2]|uniref:HNH endonuclease signature motif containing protein n=1 Tax=Cryobacterium sp. SO2 TaxID=1897060 RepID=UPI0023DACE96|nr:HNH endonuclease signature motif containing protein [Cryobacterium sp. SO2]WEO77079.1 DUF222 domain-containing protein [Cryobacterium sp. SO2]
MTIQSSIADTFAASGDDALLGAAGEVARLGSCSADYDRLSDAAALAGQRILAQAQHELDTRKAWMAKTLAQRSRWELGQDGLAQQQGFRSPEDLIQKLTGSTRVESRKLVGVGRMLAETEEADARQADAGDTLDLVAPLLPPAPWHAPISRAVNDGTLSIDAAHALRTGLGDIDTVVTGPVLATAVADLLAEAPSLNADQLLKRARQTRDSLDEAGIRVREQKAWDDRYLHIWILDTGQVRIDGLFPPEQGEFIKATFDSLTSPRRGGVRFVDTDRAAWATRVQNDPRTTTQITCDGFVDLLTAGTTVNPNEMLGGRRPAVQILTTHTPAGHGYIEGNNAPVSPETIERHICDSGTIDLTFDQLGRPLNVGHEQRLFNRAQRRALAARDGGCRWPGCDRPPAFTEAHHIEHWQRDNGRTDIDQGILLCRAHHLLLHNQHWQIFENTGHYWLRPPTTIDPGQKLIEMPSHTQPRLT